MDAVYYNSPVRSYPGVFSARHLAEKADWELVNRDILSARTSCRHAGIKSEYPSQYTGRTGVLISMQ